MDMYQVKHGSTGRMLWICIKINMDLREGCCGHVSR